MTEKEANPTPTSKPVGNKVTEVIIGQAAGKLSTATKGIIDATVEISKLAEIANEQSLLIVDRQNKIAELNQELKNSIAQNRIEIQQAFEADQETFFEKYLAENGLTSVPETEYNELVESLRKMQISHEADIKAAESRAFGIANADKASALKIAQLEHEKKEASNIAEISHLKAQAANLNAQVEMLTKQLDEQRKATVEVAKAGSVGTINVGAEGQRR